MLYGERGLKPSDPTPVRLVELALLEVPLASGGAGSAVGVVHCGTGEQQAVAAPRGRIALASTDTNVAIPDEVTTTSRAW